MGQHQSSNVLNHQDIDELAISLRNQFPNENILEVAVKWRAFEDSELKELQMELHEVQEIEKLYRKQHEELDSLLGHHETKRSSLKLPVRTNSDLVKAQSQQNSDALKQSQADIERLEKEIESREEILEPFDGVIQEINKLYKTTNNKWFRQRVMSFGAYQTKEVKPLDTGNSETSGFTLRFIKSIDVNCTLLNPEAASDHVCPRKDLSPDETSYYVWADSWHPFDMSPLTIVVAKDGLFPCKLISFYDPDEQEEGQDRIYTQQVAVPPLTYVQVRSAESSAASSAVSTTSSVTSKNSSSASSASSTRSAHVNMYISADFTVKGALDKIMAAESHDDGTPMYSLIETMEGLSLKINPFESKEEESGEEDEDSNEEEEDNEEEEEKSDSEDEAGSDDDEDDDDDNDNENEKEKK